MVAIAALVDTDTLSAAQLRVLNELMAVERPELRVEYGPEVREAFRDQIDEVVGPLLEPLVGKGDEPFFVRKRTLTQIHGCELHYRASVDEPFLWTIPSARGQVAHGALSVYSSLEGEPVPRELVDHAIQRIIDGDGWGSPKELLQSADRFQLAELRASATDAVTKFIEGWPPIQPWMNLTTETAADAFACDGRLKLRGVADLIMGTPFQRRAQRLVIDLKTGSPYNNHLDDLRYYALVHLLRSGIPPFRVASYYLDSCEWVMEDVTHETLQVAARRLTDGVRKMVEVLHHREPSMTSCSACRFCPLSGSCEGASEWAARSQDRNIS